MGSGRLYLALIHHPVYNKNGEVVASAISNLDLHDISRAAKTYGVQALYVVSPLADQREIAKRIVLHWTRGIGAKYNPDRKVALELVRVVSSLDAARDDIFRQEGDKPVTVVPDARPRPHSISYSTLCERLRTGGLYLLIFGTAWGLTQEFIEAADYVLVPIMGPTGYNHLSVRSAAAIVLDRLLGKEQINV